MRHTALLLLALSACGRSLPELVEPGQPVSGSGSDSSGGTSAGTAGSSTAGDATGGTGSTGGSTTSSTTGGSSTGALPPAPLPTTGLVDDFKDGNGTAEGWGVWKTYGGGGSSPTDEQHSASFTAPGFADNSAQLTYTADSGSYSYSQLALVFDANQNLHSNTGLQFHMKGAGPGVVGLYLMTSLSTAGNNFATYGISFGAASDDWQLYDVKLSDLTGTGSPPFSLADALAPGHFQGFKWNVGKPNGNTPIQNKTLQLDDVALHP